MISKPLITTLTIWIASVFGWAGSEVNNQISAESAPVAVVAEVTQPQLLEESVPESILLQSFKFNEVSQRVANLQKAIGTLLTDGH